MTLPRASALFSLLTLSFFGGACSTTAPVTPSGSTTTATPTAPTSGTAPAPSTSFAREAMKQLRLGMTKEEVIGLVGRPREIKPRPQPGFAGEIWTYTNTLDPAYREVAVEVEEVPFVDPITGIERTILDPRPQLERISREEFFHLTFSAQDKLVDLNYELVKDREL